MPGVYSGGEREGTRKLFPALHTETYLKFVVVVVLLFFFLLSIEHMVFMQLNLVV